MAQRNKEPLLLVEITHDMAFYMANSDSWADYFEYENEQRQRLQNERYEGLQDALRNPYTVAL